MWQRIKLLFIPKKKSEWLPMWHSSGVWVDEHDRILGNCYYTIRYYPDEHKVTLHCTGNNYENHVVHSTALKVYYQLKRWMNKYDRNYILSLINEIDTRELVSEDRGLMGHQIKTCKACPNI